MYISQTDVLSEACLSLPPVTSLKVEESMVIVREVRGVFSLVHGKGYRHGRGCTRTEACLCTQV